SEYYLMLGFLILMLVDNHRLVLAELCSAIEKADLLRDASIANLTIIPIAVFLVALGLSYYGLVLAIIIGEVIFVATIIRKLWQAGYSLRFDLFGQLRIATAAAISISFGYVVDSYLPDGIFWIIVGTAAIGIFFVAAARLLRPLNPLERGAIERLVGRKVYVV
ncbi:MAG: hypothetical protein ACR2Q4_19860, partial [Geminicoccaceae bacterium]